MKVNFFEIVGYLHLYNQYGQVFFDQFDLVGYVFLKCAYGTLYVIEPRPGLNIVFP